jgi:PAS domain S-box-containing protein
MSTSSKQSTTALSPSRILLLVLIVVFAAEAAVMIVLPILVPSWVDNRIRAVIDACLLTLAAAPFLWWLVIRPLRRFATTEQAKADSIVAAAVEGIITIDERGIVDSFNPAAEGVFGYRAEEIVGCDVAVLVPAEYLARHRDALRNYRETGQSTILGKTIEVPGRRKDGSLVPLELSVSELNLGNRRLFTGVFRDLTANKVRARQQQVMVEFGHRALVCTDLTQLLGEAAQCVTDTLGVEHGLVWEVAADGRKMTLRAGVGWHRGVVGHATLDASPNGAGSKLLVEEPVLFDNRETDDPSASARLLREHDVRCGVSVMVQGGDRPYGVLGAYSKKPRTFHTDDVHFLQDIAIEITLAVQRMRAEFQIREREILRAEQMAAVAQIATGVAHEIRNPLTSIKMLIQAGRETLTAGGLHDEDLDIIENEIRRMERSLKTFLDFARPPKLERRTVDLRTVVERTFALTQARASQQQVELKATLPDDPVMAQADEDQIQQLLLNLTLNAMDAMPQGGTLDVQLDPPRHNRLELRVLDTGAGIPPQVSERLFQPFVTSKETGVGLGLVISRRIAEDHGGTLSGNNRREGGACFAVQLPVSLMQE